MSFLLKIMIGIIFFLGIVLSWAINKHNIFRTKYLTVSSQLEDQIAINKNYEFRVKQLNQIDTHYSKELADAKNEINRLRAISEHIPERMYINAQCTKKTNNTTTGLDDAASTRPADAAVQNYWLLRERMITTENIILGLQDYIRTECIQ